jgi:hypothetical protein
MLETDLGHLKEGGQVLHRVDTQPATLPGDEEVAAEDADVADGAAEVLGLADEH